MLAIPADTFIRSPIAAAMRDDFAEGVNVVEGVRGADCGPLGVIELGGLSARYILAQELPADIEVESLTWGGRRCEGIGCGGKDFGIDAEQYRQASGGGGAEKSAAR